GLEVYSCYHGVVPSHCHNCVVTMKPRAGSVMAAPGWLAIIDHKVNFTVNWNVLENVRKTLSVRLVYMLLTD
uniref:Uncharacterized protein n=1 Tax=Poecilia reticulata TaxID=8081 RepID=A0A3P9PSS5_POERE